MKIVGTPGSPYTRKVRVVALERGLAAEFVLDPPLGPQSRVPALNPLGKVPILVRDDGTTLVDSPVIAQYLDACGEGAGLLPADGAQRIAVLEWEAIADGVTDAAVLVRLEQMRPEGERSPGWVARQREKMERGAQRLDAHLGARNRCVGTSLTLADVATGCALFYLEFRFPEGAWRSRFANLGRLLDELERRPSFCATPMNP